MPGLSADGLANKCSTMLLGMRASPLPIELCPWCGHHRQQHIPEHDGTDCYWICTMVDPEGPCLCSDLCAREVPPRHEHGWIDLEEAAGD